MRKPGISLEKLQRNRASSRFEGRFLRFFSSFAGNLGFLLSYDGDLRDPLVLPQESPLFMQGARGLGGFLTICCHGRGPHLELRPSGFFSSADMDLGVPP